MKTTIVRGAGLFFAAIALLEFTHAGHDPRQERPSLSKTSGNPVKINFNINQMSSGIYANGWTDYNIDLGGNSWGMFYPRGSGKGAIYLSGVIWGAHYGVGGPLKVGGTSYPTGLQPGKVLPGMVPESPDLPKNRIYRVRPDIPPGNRSADVSSEIKDGEGTAEAISAQYQTDWNEWPSKDGAPFDDRNHNGTYEPSIDVPGVPGADQTIWYVANDLNPEQTVQLFQGTPMGIEMQMTIWGYRQDGPLGQVMFRRCMLINKSPTIFDSTYVSLLVDPDMGDPNDDLVGCDTTRSLGFVYNGQQKDFVYDPLPPPAIGFDFFQGPVVDGAPSDSAIVQGKRVYGRRNLPMTAFYPFAGNASAAFLDPSWGDRQGAFQMYNFLRGLIGRTGEPYTDPNGIDTKFPFAGNPETRTGWLDGQTIPRGDRRLGISSGPFTMAPGDTQEVVVATVCGGAIAGSDRLSAIGIMKFYDDQAQTAYNNFFAVPSPPALPSVTPVALDHEIVLSWGDDLATVARTESPGTLGYAFQGYNVYQLPSASASFEEAKRIRTLDVIDGVGKIQDEVYDPAQGVVAIKVKQFGTDSGIERSIRIKTDDLTGGNPLVNGTRYYFAVTAYNYNPTPGIIPATLETPMIIRTVIPQSPNPGTRYAGRYGDTITTVSHTVIPGVASSDGSVIPLIVDPTRLTGQTYAVTFDTSGTSVTWRLSNISTGKVFLSNQTNQSGDVNYSFTDGIQVKVLGAPPGMKDWEIPRGNRKFTWADGVGNLGLEGFFGGDGSGTIGNAYEHWFSGSTVGPEKLRNVVLKLATADGTWNPRTTQSDTNFSRGYRFLRLPTKLPAKPEFASWIVDTSASYAYQDYNYGVPFSAWNVETNPPTRLAVGHLENNVAGGLVDGRYWPPEGTVVGGSANWDATGPREWFFIFDIPYSSTPNPALTRNILQNALPIMWVGTVCRRSGNNSTFSAGDEFEIFANHINWPGNSFSFTAPKNTIADPALARADVSQINVFPNPYYGVNPQELTKFVRFVTFNHLPQRAIIRIFNLGGVMVRRIDREGPSQFERWDLKNDAGLPVGSGMYIAYIEMPDLGVTKTLKIAVVQEQQILDRF